MILWEFGFIFSVLGRCLSSMTCDQLVQQANWSVLMFQRYLCGAVVKQTHSIRPPSCERQKIVPWMQPIIWRHRHTEVFLSYWVLLNIIKLMDQLWFCICKCYFNADIVRKRRVDVLKLCITTPVCKSRAQVSSWGEIWRQNNYVKLCEFMLISLP